MLLRFAASLLVSATLTVPAFAADWLAAKLRGSAEMLVDDTWIPLARGDAVPDDRQVRTLADSRLELQLGDDIVALGPDTLVSIEDRTDDAHTIVHQEIGTVEVEAGVRASDHLTVETRFLAAVVKGTHFIVTADETGASVEVTQGLVAVRATDSQQATAVPAGNSASVRGAEPLRVAGVLPLPVIFDATGAELPRPEAVEPYRPRPPAGGSVSRAAVLWPLGMRGVEAASADASGAARPASGLDMLTTGSIGVAIGIMLGSLGLLFRRFFR